MAIFKRDMVQMSRTQQQAGKQMWQKTGSVGRLARSSFDAEAMAPKTWLLWVNNKGEPACNPIECELYAIPHSNGSGEQVGMLHGMCPACGETFVVREDNKEMSVEYMPYRKAPKFMRAEFARHCYEVLGRRVSDEDKIPVISSSEPWLCDYCKEWGVRVTCGVAVPDMTRVGRMTIDMSTGRGVPMPSASELASGKLVL